MSGQVACASGGLYTEPTYAQVERLIAAAGGTPRGGSLYHRPTYAQVERLIDTVRGSGGAVDVVVPADAAARGVTFTCAKPNPDPDGSPRTCGEEDNGAVEIGLGARATVTQAALSEAQDGTVARSVSVAVGAYADATVSSNSIRSQAIAIGWHAQAKGSNAIAIGGGAQHTFEDVMSGAASYAKGSEAVAIGYDAKALADGAVQIGKGTNSMERSLCFREWLLLNKAGQIPADRLKAAMEEMAGGVMSELDRLVSPGNTLVVYGGEWEQTVEPRLDGVCELEMSKGTNEVYMAGAEAFVAPPLGSRNYDIVVTNIPQAYRWDTVDEERKLVALPASQNCIIDFSEVPPGIRTRLRCDPSVGYVTGSSAVLTNAPLVIKVRQPATNRVVAVVKPWDEMLDL